MQSSRNKASSFPYLVMLCVIVAHALLQGFAIFSILHRAMPDESEHLRETVLYMSLGSDITFQVIYAAFSLGFTQWWLERRRIEGLPGYASPCVGILSVVLGAAWGFVSALLVRHIAAMFMGSAGMSFALTVSVLVGYVIGPLLLIFSMWLVFHLLRGQEKPAAGPVELRGRALLIFTLFAWSWVLLALVLWMPTLSAYYSAEDIDPTLLHLGPYAGSFGLVLPVFFGALLGLPRSMPAARPVFLWLAATLAMLVNAIVMVVAAFVVVRVAMLLGVDVQPTISLAVWAALAWFALSTPLCWLLVRLLISPQSGMRFDAPTLNQGV